MPELFYFTNVKLRDLTFLYDNLFFHLPCLVLLFLLESLFLFTCLFLSSNSGLVVSFIIPGV